MPVLSHYSPSSECCSVSSEVSNDSEIEWGSQLLTLQHFRASGSLYTNAPRMSRHVSLSKKQIAELEIGKTFSSAVGLYLGIRLTNYLYLIAPEA